MKYLIKITALIMVMGLMSMPIQAQSSFPKKIAAPFKKAAKAIVKPFKKSKKSAKNSKTARYQAIPANRVAAPQYQALPVKSSQTKGGQYARAPHYQQLPLKPANKNYAPAPHNAKKSYQPAPSNPQYGKLSLKPPGYAPAPAKGGIYTTAPFKKYDAPGGASKKQTPSKPAAGYGGFPTQSFDNSSKSTLPGTGSVKSSKGQVPGSPAVTKTNIGVPRKNTSAPPMKSTAPGAKFNTAPPSRSTAPGAPGPKYDKVPPLKSTAPGAPSNKNQKRALPPTPSKNSTKVLQQKAAKEAAAKAAAKNKAKQQKAPVKRSKSGRGGRKR